MHTLAALPPWLEKFWPIALLLVAISIALLSTVEILRRRSEKMRGMSPG